MKAKKTFTFYEKPGHAQDYVEDFIGDFGVYTDDENIYQQKLTGDVVYEVEITVKVKERKAK